MNPDSQAEIDRVPLGGQRWVLPLILESLGWGCVIAAIGLGQYIVSNPQHPSVWFQDNHPTLNGWLALLPEYVFPVNAYSMALICTAAACCLFVALRFRSLETLRDDQEEAVHIESKEGIARDPRWWIVVPVLSGIAVACLLTAMAQTSSRPWLDGESFLGWLLLNTRGIGPSNTAGWWWLAGLSFGLLAFAFADWIRSSLPRISGAAWEYAFVAALTLAVGAYYCVDLVHWRYAIIGDEYAFLHHAEVRMKLAAWSIFSEEGVYGTHPELSSLYQTLFLQLLGDTAFAWRFSSVVAGAAAIPPFYLLVRLLLGARAAVAGSILLAVSHYGFAFAHLPYNNNHVLFPVLAALALYLWGWRYGSLLACGLAGMGAGLGFYTFFSARIGIVLLAVIAGIHLFPWSRSRVARISILAGAIAFGFLLMALPIIRNPLQSVQLMLDQTTFGYQNETPVDSEAWKEKAFSAESMKRIEQNIVHSLLSPLTFDASRASKRHFVRGGLVDRITAALALLGFSYLVFWGWKPRWAIILFPYLITLASVGFVSNGDYPLLTRMLITVPFLILAALVAIEKIFCCFSGRLAAVVLGVTLVGVVGLNLNRSLVEVHTDPAPSWDSAVLALAQTSPQATHIYYILQPDYNRDTIGDVMRIYGYNNRFGLVIAHDPLRVPAKLREPCLVAINTYHKNREAMVRRILGWKSESKVWEWRPAENGSGVVVVEVGETGWDRSGLAASMRDITSDFQSSP